jgi:hypothetical protein
MGSVEGILDSRLLRAALRSNCLQTPKGIMVYATHRHLLDKIDQLARNVQFSEFTEHGIPHIGSLVERISEWTLTTVDPNIQRYLINELTANEALLLALAVFFHDIGMLSQRAEDLPPEKRYALGPYAVDVAKWVRRTHVDRLDGLVKHILGEHSCLRELLSGPSNEYISAAIRLGESHREWPTDSVKPAYDALSGLSISVGISSEHLHALAAVLAVVDLLDEDHRRCDTDALLGHKQATTINRSHWLKHLLVLEPPMIKCGRVDIKIAQIGAWRGRIPAAMEALTQYLCNAKIYNSLLSHLEAQISIHVHVEKNGQDLPVKEIDYFSQAPDVHLLRAFPDEAKHLMSITADEVLLDASKDCMEAIVTAAKVVDGISPADHDAIITLRAAKAYGDQQGIASCKKLIRRHAMRARERGEIALALKLVREYSYEQ